MSSRGFQSGLGMVAAGLKGVGLSLSAVALFAGSGAIAAEPFQIAQSTTTPGDVVVETDPQPGTTPGTGSPTISGTRFSCQVVNSQYTVMYSPESQPGQFYPWATPGRLGGGWSSDRRCNEITRRLESYRPDGLTEMRTAVENGYNTICVTTQAVPSCRIVLTVPPGQDPVQTRDRVFENLTVADSGQQTFGVNTLLGQDRLPGQLGALFGRTGNRARSAPINLRPFLDRADGGTAERLRSTTNQAPAKRRPSLFNRLR